MLFFTPFFDIYCGDLMFGVMSWDLPIEIGDIKIPDSIWICLWYCPLVRSGGECLGNLEPFPCLNLLEPIIEHDLSERVGQGPTVPGVL